MIVLIQNKFKFNDQLTMNWLLGGSRREQEGTPVHKWALDAFKGSIFPDSPIHGPIPYDSPAANGQSILKTPGQTKKDKRVNVTFHKSVETPPKAKRSSVNLPGKFPSPWTPKIDDNADESETENAGPASPISKAKDTSDVKRGNSLKTLTMKLDRTTHDLKARATTATQPRHATKHTKPRSLNWDVEKGFEEVLDCITKNNTYLQELISEMQESQSVMDESFYTDNTQTSDYTVNLDEPRSRSGNYWKQKFTDLSSLTKRVQVEQDNMARALEKLKTQVGNRETQQYEDYKDRHDVLKEELEREKRSNKASSQSRLTRDLRKQIEELQKEVAEKDELREELDIADLQIKDLQNQLKQRSVPVASTAKDRPLSATSRRLEEARKNTPKPAIDVHRHNRFGSRDIPAPLSTRTNLPDEDKDLRKLKAQQRINERKLQRQKSSFGKENIKS